MAYLTEGLIEEALPVVKYHGLNTNKNVQVGGSAKVDFSNSTGTFKFPTGEITGNDSVALAATFAEINSIADESARIVNVTAATLTVTQATHSGKIIILNRAAGIEVTLPAASGSGGWYRFIVGTTFTGASTIKVVGDDTMIGTATLFQDVGDTVVGFAAGGTDDTIDMLGTSNSTGGIAGEKIELIDIAADLWAVTLVSDAGGTEATPFSATVT